MRGLEKRARSHADPPMTDVFSLRIFNIGKQLKRVNKKAERPRERFMNKDWTTGERQEIYKWTTSGSTKERRKNNARTNGRTRRQRVNGTRLYRIIILSDSARARAAFKRAGSGGGEARARRFCPRSIDWRHSPQLRATTEDALDVFLGGFELDLFEIFGLIS